MRLKTCEYSGFYIALIKENYKQHNKNCLMIFHIFDFSVKLGPTQIQNVFLTKIIFNAAWKNISREILKQLQTQPVNRR